MSCSDSNSLSVRALPDANRQRCCDRGIRDVVTRALLGIAQNPIGFDDLAKAVLISALTVVRMKTLGEQAIYPVDGFGLRIRTYLQNLVMILNVLHDQMYRFYISSSVTPSRLANMDDSAPALSK